MIVNIYIIHEINTLRYIEKHIFEINIYIDFEVRLILLKIILFELAL